MKKRFHTVLLWILAVLGTPFYLLYLLGKFLFLNIRKAGEKEGFFHAGGYLTSAAFSDQRRLGGFLNFYYETRAAFRNTNGSNYNPYTKKVLTKLFDFYPVAHSNDISKKNLGSLTVHHIKPQSQIKNDPVAMTDFNNLAPCTRPTHDKADNGMRVESLAGTKRKYTFRFLLFSLVNLVASSFLLGFLSEIFYRIFSALKSKHSFEVTDLLDAGLRAGISMLFVSLPIAGAGYLLALVSGRVLVLSILLQVFFSLALLALGIRVAIRKAKAGDTPKRTLCFFAVHALCLFAVGIAVETVFSLLIAYTLWKDLAVSALLALIFALDRFFFGSEKETEEQETIPALPKSQEAEE